MNKILIGTIAILISLIVILSLGIMNQRLLILETYSVIETQNIEINDLASKVDTLSEELAWQLSNRLEYNVLSGHIAKLVAKIESMERQEDEKDKLLLEDSNANREAIEKMADKLHINVYGGN